MLGKVDKILQNLALQGRIWQEALELLRFRLLRLMDGIGIKAKVLGEIFSSNGLLSDGTYIKLLTQLQLICEEIAG